MSGLRVLSMSARRTGTLLVSGSRFTNMIPSRQISKKVMKHGGFVRKGNVPGFPANTDANVSVPGESEEPDQVISTMSWLGESKQDDEKVYEKGEWTPNSTRTGAIARKVGLINVWDARGIKTLCTVMQVDDCQVTKVRKFISGRGTPRINMQLGAVPENPKKLKKSELCYFRKLGVAPKKKLAEFPVSIDAVLPVGTIIDARHFVAGQYVDIVGRSNPKGFQGGMKRWGFSGQAATHGVSKTHRAIGSTGACQDPGKTFKGKKMPGHSGDNRVTFLNMQIYKIDTKRNLLFLLGHVPGKVDTTITLVDAARKPWNPNYPPPFPTYVPEAGDEEIDELVMDVSNRAIPEKALC